MNDPVVAELGAELLDSMIKGKWKKGSTPAVDGLKVLDVGMF